MSRDFPKIIAFGERAILVKFEPEINENTLQKVLFHKTTIENFYNEVKVEVINTYNSLLIYYPIEIENIYSEISALKKLFQETNIGENSSSQIFRIPVSYDAAFGLDLELISKEKNITFEQIIKLHIAPIYTVYFIGFLPGFLYLGGLDKKLRISRKTQPRLKIEKGAVGIGENQTGIYPKTSPGGWQIIGNSPVPLFDKNNDPPCEISPGDKVKFYPVSKQEYIEISGEVKSGNFQFQKEKYES